MFGVGNLTDVLVMVVNLARKPPAGSHRCSLLSFMLWVIITHLADCRSSSILLYEALEGLWHRQATWNCTPLLNSNISMTGTPSRSVVTRGGLVVTPRRSHIAVRPVNNDISSAHHEASELRHVLTLINLNQVCFPLPSRVEGPPTRPSSTLARSLLRLSSRLLALHLLPLHRGHVISVRVHAASDPERVVYWYSKWTRCYQLNCGCHGWYILLCLISEWSCSFAIQSRCRAEGVLRGHCADRCRRQDILDCELFIVLQLRRSFCPWRQETLPAHNWQTGEGRLRRM